MRDQARACRATVKNPVAMMPLWEMDVGVARHQLSREAFQRNESIHGLPGNWVLVALPTTEP